MRDIDKNSFFKEMKKGKELMAIAVFSSLDFYFQKKNQKQIASFIGELVNIFILDSDIPYSFSHHEHESYYGRGVPSREFLEDVLNSINKKSYSYVLFSLDYALRLKYEGHTDQALKLYEKYIKIVEKKEGRDSFRAVTVRYNIASALIEKGEGREAIKIIEDCLRSYKELDVPMKTIMFTEENLGTLLYNEGEYDESLTHLKNVLSYYDREENDRERLKNINRTIALLYLAKEDGKNALRYAKDAYTNCMICDKEDSEESIRYLMLLSRAYIANGLYEKGIKSAKKCFSFYHKTYGLKDKRTLEALRYQAEGEYLNGDAESAERDALKCYRALKSLNLLDDDYDACSDILRELTLKRRRQY